MRIQCPNVIQTGALGAFLIFSQASAPAQVPQTPPPIAPTYITPTYYSAPSPDIGFHLGVDGGGSIMQDFNSSRLGFPGRFSMRTGGAFTLAPEYDFLATSGLTLGAVFETGLIENDIHSVKDAGAWTPLHGDYYQVPLLAGLMLKFHPNSFISPYIGVAGGGEWSRLSIDHADYFGVRRNDDRLDPAVQGMAGVRFRLNSFSELGIGYKFLADLQGGSGNDTTLTHAVLASFDFRF